MAKKNKNINNNVELIKQSNEETDQVKAFVFILVGVALVAVALYFLSSKVLVKDGVTSEPEETEETIAYNNVNVGTVFNRVESEYYVFAFDSTSLKASYYSALMSTHDSAKSKVYFMDLAVELNKKYVSETGNKDATKASELAIKEPTLILIKDGKIAKYLEDEEDIANEL